VPLTLTRMVFHGHPNLSAGTCGTSTCVFVAILVALLACCALAHSPRRVIVPQYLIRQGPQKDVVYKSKFFEVC
jgi:hypothetical protein